MDEQLQLTKSKGIDPAKRTLPASEGELEFITMHVDLDYETSAALERRADVKLARLFVRAANEDERIIAADYYPDATGGLRRDWVPDTGIHRQETTSRTQVLIGSEIRARAASTWRRVDNGKAAGAI